MWLYVVDKISIQTGQIDTAEAQGDGGLVDPVSLGAATSSDGSAGASMTFLNSTLTSHNGSDAIAIAPELANSLITASSNSLLLNSYLRADQAVRLLESSKAEVDVANKRPVKGMLLLLEAQNNIIGNRVYGNFVARVFRSPSHWFGRLFSDRLPSQSHDECEVEETSHQA